MPKADRPWKFYWLLTDLASDDTRAAVGARLRIGSSCSQCATLARHTVRVEETALEEFGEELGLSMIAQGIAIRVDDLALDEFGSAICVRMNVTVTRPVRGWANRGIGHPRDAVTGPVSSRRATQVSKRFDSPSHGGDAVQCAVAYCALECLFTGLTWQVDASTMT
eukprot:1199309-Amphidinium_carterae.1